MRLIHLLTCLGFLLVFNTAEARTAHRITPPDTRIEKTENSSATLSKKEQRKLERKEKKEARKQFRQQVKAWFKNLRSTMADDLLLIIIIAILLPPLGMYLYEGSATNRFWISLLLWLLFYVPGLIYTLVVILGEN